MSKIIKLSDDFTCDLSRIKGDRKQKFIDQVKAFRDGVASRPPYLIATVAATHAGIVTRNQAFYRPDVMKKGLDSFLNPFPKPVLKHHNEQHDPVGRVKRADYIDTSFKYLAQIKEFRDYFGTANLVDAASDQEKAFDQVKWIIRNLVPMTDYEGLGYGELDLYISDADAAAKILDERYLNVSVGFSTNEIYCSTCHTDWANEDRCEHTPGKIYDGVKMALIPAKFLYDEVSWVNTPADPKATVTRVADLGVSNLAPPNTDFVEKTQDQVDFSILSVVENEVYRIDSYKEIPTIRVQEVLEVVMKDNKTKPETESEFVEVDGVKFPVAAKSLLEDMSREHYLAEKDSEHGHAHRLIIDPATGNGHSDYVLGHSHDVVSKVVQTAKIYDWEDKDENGEPKVTEHTHPFGQKLEKLTDTGVVDEVATNVDAVKEGVDENKEDKGDGATAEEMFTDDQWDYDKLVLPMLDALAAEFGDNSYTDAKLSSEQRKKLSAGTFCGPNRSFPVPDCAHYTAAKRLLGRYKGEGSKSRISACIERKGRGLKCGGSSDSAEPEVIEVVIKRGDNTETLGITTQEQLEQLVFGLSDEDLKTNKDVLEVACTVYGLVLDEVVSSKPLTESIAEADKKFLNVNKSIIDKLIESMVDLIGDDAERKELGEYIVDKLIERSIIEDIYAEFNLVVKELEDAKAHIAKLAKANKDLYARKQNDLARQIVALKVALKKPDFADMDEAAIDEKAKELSTHSVDSLAFGLDELISEFAALDKKKDVTSIPTEIEITDAVTTMTTQGKTPEFIDMDKYRGFSDEQYRRARILEAKYKKK